MKKNKNFIIVSLLVLYCSINLSAQDSASVKIYDKLLKKYVHNGLVDYVNLTKDKGLNSYINALSKFNPNTLTSNEDKLAFWINAYNAYTLKVIVDNYPVSSINDLHSGGRIIGHILKTTVWDKDFVVINNKNMTLNEIEHEIIRPKFKDPRVHFALVCAAVSCPPLRNEAFVGEKLNEQLNDQGKIFLSDQSKNSFDVKNKIADLSKILDWFGSDFGNNNTQILLRIKEYLPKQISESLDANIINWDINFKTYNWELNKVN